MSHGVTVLQQEALYRMASQLSAAAQLRNAQALQYGPYLSQPPQMPGTMSALQQVVIPQGKAARSLLQCYIACEASAMHTPIR